MNWEIDGSKVPTTSFYKTKMCPFLENTGRCLRGDQCTYAHYPDELKVPPNLRKTKLCQVFLKSGACPNESRCNYAHGYRELKSTPEFFKTSLCLSFEKNGYCALGKHCRYAHGEEELRTAIHGEQLEPLRLMEANPEENEVVCDQHRQFLTDCKENRMGENVMTKKNKATTKWNPLQREDPSLQWFDPLKSKESPKLFSRGNMPHFKKPKAFQSNPSHSRMNLPPLRMKGHTKMLNFLSPQSFS